MVILLIALVFITILILFIPLYMSINGGVLPSWVIDMIGAFVGSLVAVIAFVLFQLFSENRKQKKVYEKNLLLLKEELYNNFIVAIHRIVNNKDDIDFFYNAYDNFLVVSDTLVKKQQRNMYKEMSKLYFVITRGNQTLKPVTKFYYDTFTTQNKKPQNFEEVKEIIQSAGIDYIFEFAVIRYIILLNDNNNLNLILPFNDFENLIKYQQSHKTDLEVRQFHFLTRSTGAC